MREKFKTMANDVIKMYGAENEKTIKFIEMCNNFPYGEKLIKGKYNLLKKEYENK